MELTRLRYQTVAVLRAADHRRIDAAAESAPDSAARRDAVAAAESMSYALSTLCRPLRATRGTLPPARPAGAPDDELRLACAGARMWLRRLSLDPLRAAADEPLTAAIQHALRACTLLDSARAGLAAAPPDFEVGPVRIDARDAYIAGAGPCGLQRLEHRFLSLLVEHAGRAVTRDAFARDVWNQATESHSHLSTLAHKLRHKLLVAGPHAPRIDAVRGVGYRLTTGAAAPRERVFVDHPGFRVWLDGDEIRKASPADVELVAALAERRPARELGVAWGGRRGLVTRVIALRPKLPDTARITRRGNDCRLTIGGVSCETL